MESINIGALLEQIGSLVTTWGLRVIGAVAFLVIGRAIARWLRKSVRAALARKEADAALVPFISGIAYWLAILLVLVAVLGLFGIPTASFVAVLGAAGLAVGLALQGTLSNFAAGVMLLIFRPFGIRDVVEVAGAVGKVEEIGIFSTILNTPDNVRIVVPNAEIFGQVIKNYTGNDKRRIDLVIGVAYDDDLGLAQRTIESTLVATPGVLSDPAPVVAVHELGDSSVNLVARPWCETDGYWDVRWEATRRVKEALDAAGCSIPFPQRDVHLISEDTEAA
jgi:small conductance mechanosensitive channel